jgi:hypothetical protein
MKIEIGIEFSDHGKTWKLIDMEYPINKDFPKGGWIARSFDGYRVQDKFYFGEVIERRLSNENRT